MPPHCDSMDGPVVLAAKRALEAHDPTLALPYVKPEGEPAPHDEHAEAHEHAE